MAIASTTNSVDVRPGTMKNLSFSTRLFLTVLLLFITFVSCFIFFQYNREKMYKTELLNTKLQSLNVSLYELTKYYGLSDSLIMQFAEGTETVEGIAKPRFTVIKDDGLVIYDSENKRSMDNHSDRPEIRKAMHDKSAYVISRRSDTMKRDYFYSATYFKDAGIVVRSSLPYDINLNKMLSVDIEYILVILVVTAILLLLLFRYTRNIGKVFHQLNQFFTRAKSGEDISQVNIKFPGNGLGDLARHIIELYGEIRESEEDKARLKRQLTQNISHELKTPVSSIKGFLETIVDNPDMPGATRDQFIRRCYDQANRLSSLLHDIMTLTRMDEDDSTHYEKSKINILTLLDTIESETKLQLQERKMQFLKLVSPQVYVEANYSLLYSIFRNLTDNSISYAGVGTTITIRHIGEDEAMHTFQFSDNGVGVDPRHLPHLFERFYRVDKGRSRKLGGTGLGLAIVKNAVLFHNGNIQVRRSESGGLEFVFTLPKPDRAASVD